MSRTSLNAWPVGAQSASRHNRNRLIGCRLAQISLKRAQWHFGACNSVATDSVTSCNLQPTRRIRLHAIAMNAIAMDAIAQRTYSGTPKRNQSAPAIRQNYLAKYYLLNLLNSII